MEKKRQDDSYNSWIDMEIEKRDVLNFINDMGSIDVKQASEFLHKPVEEAGSLLEKFEKEFLVQRKIGNYYQLTFKGYKWLQSSQSERFSQRR